MDIQIVILAGGKGTRLGPLTASQPKSMIMVAGKPFLEYQIDMLQAAGVQHILLCLGHLSKKILDYMGSAKKHRGLDITYSFEERPLGTAGALKNAEYLLNETFMTLYGDSYLFLNLREVLASFRRSKKLALMTVYRNNDRYAKNNTVIGKNGIVVEYNKNCGKGLEYIDYGLNVFQKNVLRLIPAGGKYSLEQVFDRLIKTSELVSFEAKRRFYEVGSPAGLAEFERFITEKNK